MNIFSNNKINQSAEIYFVRRADGLPASYDFYTAIVVNEGVVSFKIDNRKNVLRQYSAVLVPPGVTFSLSRYRGIQHTLMIVAFDKAFVTKTLDNFYPDFRDYILALDQPLFLDLQKDRTERILTDARMSYTLPETYSPVLVDRLRTLAAHRILTAFFEEFTFKSPLYPEWLSEFIAQMVRPDFIKLKIEEMATFSGYSYSHLTKLFKQYTGQTLIEYFKSAKLHLAINMLLHTDYSCQKIAECAGYKSVSHFTKTFRETFGITPYEYRISYLNKE